MTDQSPPTLRQYAAIAAMQGLCACNQELSPRDIARFAIDCADFLLEELQQEIPTHRQHRTSFQGHLSDEKHGAQLQLAEPPHQPT